jgi:hypothetical protein
VTTIGAITSGEADGRGRCYRADACACHYTCIFRALHPVVRSSPSRTCSAARRAESARERLVGVDAPHRLPHSSRRLRSCIAFYVRQSLLEPTVCERRCRGPRWSGGMRGATWLLGGAKAARNSRGDRSGSAPAVDPARLGRVGGEGCCRNLTASNVSIMETERKSGGVESRQAADLGDDARECCNSLAKAKSTTLYALSWNRRCRYGVIGVAPGERGTPGQLRNVDQCLVPLFVSGVSVGPKTRDRRSQCAKQCTY